jgi:hypothetical protein
MFGQTDTASISGTVTDASGARITSARVTLTNLATNQSRTTASNESGNYDIPFLPAGTYRLQVEASGFQTAQVERFTLQVGQAARLDVGMKLGEVSETVSVSAEAIGLQTENATVGTVIDQQKVAELPLNGRSFIQLALLTPGVNPVTPGSLSQRSSGGSLGQPVGMNANGARDNQNRYYYDGVEAMSFSGSESFSFSLSVDAIQEFKVESSNYSAQMGAAPGGQVNLTTKSGTNNFHGTLWEFNRNDALTTLAPFQPYTSSAKPPRLNRNQYGANLGGPLWLPKINPSKDRTFFFFNWESGRLVTGSFGGTAFVPPVPYRTGDFSGSPVTIYDPQTGKAFPDNIIPQDRIQPFASKFLSGWVPVPNDNEAAINYRGPAASAPTSQDQYVGRIDNRISDNNSISGTFIYNQQLGNSVPTFSFDTSGKYTLVHHLSVTDTHVFSPSAVNELRLGYDRMTADAFFGTTNNAQYNIANLIGIPGVSQDPRNYGPPSFSLGYDVPQVSSIGPNSQGNQLFQFEDNVSLHKGNHSVKLGSLVMRRNMWFDEAFTPRGSFVFDGRTTSGGGAPVRENTFASFLLGLATNASVSPQPFATRLNNTWQGYYFQDDWKVSSNLTLNLGLRYEYFPPPVQRGQIANFLLNGAVPGFIASQEVYHDVPRQPQATGLPPSLVRPDRNDWGPRFGFAYLVPHFSDFVVRGGYGVYYTQEIENSFVVLTFNPPIVQSLSFTGTPSQPIQVQTAFEGTGTVVTGQLGASAVDPDMRDTYVQQWNLTMEKKLPGSVLFNVGYVGTKGTNLAIGYDANRPIQTIVPSSSTASVASRRPLQGYAGVTTAKSVGNSIYHGLQMKAERRVASGLNFIGSYTYSKVLTTADQSTVGGGYYSPGIQDIFNLSGEKAPAAFDLRQRFSFAAVYDVPFFQHASSAYMRTLLGGWQVSVISTQETGFAAGLSGVGDTTGTGISSRPSVVAGQSATLANPSRTEWFNTAAFTLPQPGQFGNASRTPIYLPGLNNIDASAVKNFRIGERFNVQFRGEIFNVVNHVNLGAPGLSLLTPNTFGVITSSNQGSDTSGNQRIIQFGLKLLF